MPNPQNKKGLFQFYPHNLMWLGLSVLAIIIDQWTKNIASTHLTYADPVPVLPFLNWTLLHNYGAAFSFLSDAGGWQHYLFTGLAGIVSIIFIFWLMRMPKSTVVLPMAIALILGGAIGNLIDRISLGYVVDFIHVFYQNHHFPAFNIADSAITLGTILLLIDTFFLEKKRIQNAESAK
ncbi:lipoprotein signal peptidase [Acinetobacter wuhouensis]|jgi:signal peptidase II|uniref:Lipoprotein signal peptidase n=1 Tax=Acinetobacter wuhouensis TaxID=1879050 RepID=A0A385C070_9GAMM|nr:signal peptidase II [Acinetobacter wuhouensis]AXQ20735.1 lipoprotein signal peptidase [Acinetobacter wuhouensis]RZG48482.1 lipoprotein signal peptidase [Acinetobacter wuhouensis]